MNKDLLLLHLDVLKDLLNGQEFSDIKKEKAGEFKETGYLEKAIPSLLTFDGEVLVGAYPISPKPTNYKVEIDGVGTGYSMCAIDALGIAFTFNRPTVIHAVTIDTHEPLKLRITPDMDKFPESEFVVAYKPIDNSITNIALQICPQVNFYRFAESVPEGLQIVDMNTAFQLAKAQFSQEFLLSFFHGAPTCNC